MSSHFSPKSLAFYGIAITSVTILFSVVSAYGEKNLQAPRLIDGKFPLMAQALPGCLAAQPLILTVQQSGVYLNGALVTADAPENVLRMAQERPSLTGKWDTQQMLLTGVTNHLPNCQQQVKIQGNVQQDRLSGTVQVGSASPVVFVSQREAVPRSQSSH